MRYLYTKTIIIFVLFSLTGLFFPALAAADGPAEPTLLEAGEKGLTLSWQFPDYAINTHTVEGETYNLITMPGLDLSEQPGHPQIPLYSALIGLPPTGGAKLRIINIEKEIIQLSHPILPALTPQPVYLDFSTANPLNAISPTTGEPMALEPDEAVYAADAFYPFAAAQLSDADAQQIRFQRVTRLSINPVQVNPVTGEAAIIRSLTLEITFDQPASSDRHFQNTGHLSDPFSRVLANTLLNPEALEWGEGISPSPDGGRVSEAGGDEPYKIIVTEPGLYELTYEELDLADLPVATLDPATLKLSRGVNRQSVAIQVEGEGDGNFDSGDRILFYAAPDFSRYTNEIVYFLDFGGAAGARMETRTGDPGSLLGGAPRVTVGAEEDAYYASNYTARNGDHWYWAKFYRDVNPSSGKVTSSTVTITTSVTSPLSSDDATLTLWFHGRTANSNYNPDHKVAVSVNETSVGEEVWDGNTAPVTGTFTVPGAVLKNGANHITLSLPGIMSVSNEEVWFDALELTYVSAQAASGQHWFTGEAGQKQYAIEGVPGSVDSVAVYDITQPFTPQIVISYTLSGGTLTIGDADTSAANYLIVPDSQIKIPTAITQTNAITDPPGGADYIIITHPDFADAVAPLAAHRAITGTAVISQVVTVDVTAIYDTFGDGRMDAGAIKTYLQHAWNTWPISPTYVLLVGDGHYDFKDNLGWGNPIFIPPYLADINPWLGETASDNQLVTLAGSDNFPDVMIGRLSVNSITETQTVVDKIIHYETDPPLGEWNARHIFVAAKEEGAGHFHDNADKAYTHTVQVAPLRGYRYYYDPDGSGSESYLYTNVNDLRNAFFNSYNVGAGVSVYRGHGSWHQWASNQSAPLYDLLHLNDVNSLRNGYRLPVMLEMTCFTGYFHHPEYATLDEALLRHSGGGAVAVWGASGLGFTKGYNKLQEGFYNTAFNAGGTLPYPFPILGEAVLGGKLTLYDEGNGSNLDLLDTFTLFGDPAMTINLEFIPFPEHLYLPVVLK